MDDGAGILDAMRCVARERERRLGDPPLARAVLAVKAYQQQRFAGAYGDVAHLSGYAAAVSFFLTDLYGPYDFSRRDVEFERVVPALVRLCSADMVRTIAQLAELHLLSEQLDSQMGSVVGPGPVDDASYMRAWTEVGGRDLRCRQLDLTLAIGRALESWTRRPWLRQTLRAMRAPARAAGLGALQRFLEAGFDAFREMPDPHWFLSTIEDRESAFIMRLFGDERLK